MMAQMTALRRRMLDDMTLRNLSPATQQSYVYAVAKFSRFFDQSPDQLGVEEVRAYQIHLAGRGLSWPHLNQVSCALRFFFGVTLGRKDVVDRIVSAREPKKLPVVLSALEITRFLQAVPGLRSRAALTTAYGTGLRVRGRGAQGRRHRQQSDGNPGRTWQGRQGSLRHAFAASAGDPACLLASGQAGALAVSRPRQGSAG